MGQLAEHSWSHFCYSPLITRGSAGRDHWSHFYYSPLITRGSVGRAQLVTLLLLSTHHPWISWQSTAGQTSVTLHLSPVDQLAEYSWSHFYYSPFITRASAGRTQLVTLLLLSTHHPCVSWQSTLVTFLLLSTHHPWISWLSAAVHTSVTLQSSSVDQLVEHTGHTSVTLHSSPVDQLAEHSCSHFCYSPVIIRESAGRAQLVTLLLLSTYHPWISWQNTAGHTSVTLHSSPVCQLAEHTGHTSVTLHSSPVDQLAVHSWSHLCYSPLITHGSAGRAQLVTLLLLSTHHTCVSWQSTLVTLRLLSTHHPWISLQSTAGLTSVTLHS